jgi:glucose/arabinose dehydrogenase
MSLVLPRFRRCRTTRQSWSQFIFSTLILAAATTAAAATVELAIDDLASPVRLVAPEGDPRLFVVEQGGRIRVFSPDGTPRGDFLDLTGEISFSGEQGLLGLAFAPDYAQSGRFYVNYTDLNGHTRVVRYRVGTGNPDRADLDSAEFLLTVEQPHGNHNGGHLEFGPDGMLYVGLGDGGGGGDPDNLAQNRQTLLGKMLRLDVAGASGYTIPPDNPFVGTPTRDEIWAVGLRNPWCFSFDRLTGDLYIADVGQGQREEVDIQPAAAAGGENYGWRLMEGSLCYNPPSGCNDGTLVLPIYEYARGGSPFRCAISGGYVYRGSLAAELTGLYLFADYCSRQIWSLAWSAETGLGPVVERTGELTPPSGYNRIVGFGQDGLGELYVIDWAAGSIYRIVGSTIGTGDVPATLYLEQNIPNPFNPRTAIAYTVPAGGANIKLEVLGLDGRLVRILVDGMRPEGRQTAIWNGLDAEGKSAAAGVYLYRLRSGGSEETRKMLLLK